MPEVIHGSANIHDIYFQPISAVIQYHFESDIPIWTKYSKTIS